MKKLILFPACFAILTGAAFAQAAPEFSEIDANADGLLSTEEAKQALPDLVIVDTNNDGMLNLAEAESALPGLMFDPDEHEEGGSATVGADEYQQIVQTIEESEGDQS